MKRELKFRAWDGEQMISPDYICRDGNAYWKENSIPTYSEKVMQYTGLDLKGNIELFEGDIIKCGRVKGLIVYCIDRCGFKISWIDRTDYNEYIHVRVDNIKVIGNIYQNPELLK